MLDPSTISYNEIHAAIKTTVQTTTESYNEQQFIKNYQDEYHEDGTDGDILTLVNSSGTSTLIINSKTNNKYYNWDSTTNTIQITTGQSVFVENNRIYTTYLIVDCVSASTAPTIIFSVGTGISKLSWLTEPSFETGKFYVLAFQYSTNFSSVGVIGNVSYVI